MAQHHTRPIQRISSQRTKQTNNRRNQQLHPTQRQPVLTMPTNYELNKPVLINLRVTRRWRETAHQKAADNGMNLTEYIKHLIDNHQQAETTRG